jgi:two-component system, chemotaxis family, chemotaxis protein CheY
VKRCFPLKSILLADDSRFMRNHLKTILNNSNYTEIIEADNGVNAVEMYTKYSPNIVLMDITMPLLNGVDALKEIIKIDPQAKVVMCTSLGGQHIIKEALSVGAKDFVVKPYFQNLVLIVNKHV